MPATTARSWAQTARRKNVGNQSRSNQRQKDSARAHHTRLRNNAQTHSPLPQQLCRNLPAVLFVLKELHRCASGFGLALSLLLEFFRGSIAPRGVQPLPIVRFLDEFFDVHTYVANVFASLRV